ncbi:hypothetical protein L2E82_02754 [Cichorium intybus]|uniref:Uncharacterized protein n=1 Tax=Cichorium intybus TaxID=13427 RepID=A0ACB9H325_CICIN|nr:hypothetical protein L2E82_02754 [Cichorium intybus]
MKGEIHGNIRTLALKLFNPDLEIEAHLEGEPEIQEEEDPHPEMQPEIQEGGSTEDQKTTPKRKESTEEKQTEGTTTETKPPKAPYMEKKEDGHKKDEGPGLEGNQLHVVVFRNLLVWLDSYRSCLTAIAEVAWPIGEDDGGVGCRNMPSTAPSMPSLWIRMH